MWIFMLVIMPAMLAALVVARRSKRRDLDQALRDLGFDMREERRWRKQQMRDTP